ncbi:hypothetical protein DL769_011694 [Monosporascus sp. CRB-8-3]|nr:hypothetical protein DL769_011694 [Monosporascus sp. CRB-8-3]
MQLTSLVFVGLLAGLGVAAPDNPPPVAEWIVSNATRRRSANSTVCDWSLGVRDEKSGGPAELCRFRVEATDDKPCDRVQFHNVPCSAESDWVMNGGYSDYQDFMVVVVYNVREQAKAYFGFSSKALDKGDPIPKQIQPAFSTGPFRKQRALQKGLAGDDSPINATEWKVFDLVRIVDPELNRVIVMFDIFDGESTKECCTVAVGTSKDADPAAHLWSNQRCAESKWSVSWLYSSNHTAGGMRLTS